MADISTYLAAILAAVYGEDVRGSIHDAIEIINDVSEVVLSTGTAVSSASSSSTGFYEDSLYLNTDTYELWKCVGTDTWASQGIIKGADGSPGTPGADGNRWYRGTSISGKAVNPTVYSSSGITDAHENDFYLNPTEGAIYHCVTGGDASTATWSYDFTMTGGGGSGSIVGWNQIQTSTGATKIAEITIDGSKTDVYAPTGGTTYTAGNGIDSTSFANNIIQLDFGTVASGTTTKPVTGAAVYSSISTAVSGKANTSQLDEFTASVVQLNSKATFDNLDPSYGYDLYYDDDGATGNITVPKWAGTYTKSAGTNTGTIKLAYDITDGTDGTTKWALRILK